VGRHGWQAPRATPTIAGMSPPPDWPVCHHCGIVIGAYEPMMLSVPGLPVRRTSWLAEHELPAGHAAWHETCFSQLPDDDGHGRQGALGCRR